MNMTLTITGEGRARVARIGAPRLVYATLDSFEEQVAPCLEGEKPWLVLDFAEVNYIDSAAIGCLMDLYRRATGSGGGLAVASLAERVERMLRMTGAHEFIGFHGSVAAALAAGDS